MAHSKRTDVSNVASLVGTKFWNAVMSNGERPASTMEPAVSDPSPTVVLGGESHIHVDDRKRCEEPCLDSTFDLHESDQ